MVKNIFSKESEISRVLYICTYDWIYIYMIGRKFQKAKKFRVGVLPFNCLVCCKGLLA